MAKHSPQFLKLVESAKQSIRECSVQEVNAMLNRGDRFHLIDVREESEWAKGHVPRAEYLGKGILERDIEERIPDPQASIVLYCGGGYRSALAAEILQRMGYTHVLSMAGGFKAWKVALLPVEASP